MVDNDDEDVLFYFINTNDTDNCRNIWLLSRLNAWAEYTVTHPVSFSTVHL